MTLEYSFNSRKEGRRRKKEVRGVTKQIGKVTNGRSLNAEARQFLTKGRRYFNNQGLQKSPPFHFMDKVRELVERERNLVAKRERE